MTPLKLTLAPLAPFATPLHGDTLFGQLCWAIRNRYGEARLDSLLKGYTAGRPFVVLSDAFPAGFVPRPTLPSACFEALEHTAERKEAKKRVWLPVEALEAPLPEWAKEAWKESDLAHKDQPCRATRAQPHNTINRQTGTTGEGDFAPYDVEQTWHRPGVELDLYAALDEARLPESDLNLCLADIGQIGYGKDASTGAGKFAVTGLAPSAFPNSERFAPNAFLTLAACAPQGQGFDPENSYYQPFTRFGRHGDTAALSGQPFKNPVLLAKAGAVFAPREFRPALYIGQGLGGDGSLSKALPETVHQGYAPVVAIHLPERKET